jgi:hypothetical protein
MKRRLWLHNVLSNGDANFIRLNTTVGFYSAARQGEEDELILAVPSRYPFGG